MYIHINSYQNAHAYVAVICTCTQSTNVYAYTHKAQIFVKFLILVVKTLEKCASLVCMHLICSIVIRLICTRYSQ